MATWCGSATSRRVERASEERRAYFRSNGVENLGIGIVKTSTANSLDVARAARATAEEIQKSLPAGTEIFVAFDTTVFIDAAVKRVFTTLFEAIALVIVVIYLFLGNARSALIPAVTIPVCLVTAFVALWAFGFSINLLTLLALVLCIGLVVDDAIVVLENVQRRADLGEPPLVAARRGTAQVAFAVIATTVVLVAVFLPVGFMEGNTGRLFRELSVALASAVAISCFVALTLTPMMCSKLIRPHAGAARIQCLDASPADAPVGRLPAPGRRHDRPAGVLRRGAGRQRAGQRAAVLASCPRSSRRPRTAARSSSRSRRRRAPASTTPSTQMTQGRERCSSR